MSNVTIDGLQELEAKLNRLDASIKQVIGGRAVDAGAELLEQKAHDRCAVKGEPSADGYYPATDVWHVDPSRAGAVRRSIKRVTEGLTSLVGTNHILARQLEFGGDDGESARPFMRSSFDENRDEITEIIADRLRDGIRGAI